MGVGEIAVTPRGQCLKYSPHAYAIATTSLAFVAHIAKVTNTGPLQGVTFLSPGIIIHHIDIAGRTT